MSLKWNKCQYGCISNMVVGEKRVYHCKTLGIMLQKDQRCVLQVFHLYQLASASDTPDQHSQLFSSKQYGPLFTLLALSLPRFCWNGLHSHEAAQCPLPKYMVVVSLSHTRTPSQAPGWSLTSVWLVLSWGWAESLKLWWMTTELQGSVWDF